MSVGCGLISVGRCGTFSNLMCVHYLQEKTNLQTQLSQTMNQKKRRELERMIQKKEKEIKRWKERMQRYEEWINKNESEIQDLKEMKDKGTVFNMHTIYYVMMMKSRHIHYDDYAILSIKLCVYGM